MQRRLYPLIGFVQPPRLAATYVRVWNRWYWAILLASSLGLLLSAAAFDAGFLSLILGFVIFGISLVILAFAAVFGESCYVLLAKSCSIQVDREVAEPLNVAITQRSEVIGSK